MTLHDDLVAAKARISTPRKWRKDGKLSDGRACAWNAVFDVGGYRGFSRLEKALSEALPADAPRDDMWSGVTAYNDDPTTTHADIMALFDRAIASALHSTEGERK